MHDMLKVLLKSKAKQCSRWVNPASMPFIQVTSTKENKTYNLLWLAEPVKSDFQLN